ncbi:hypothetical protein Tco_1142493 [Tanacetum coccineum]
MFVQYDTTYGSQHNVGGSSSEPNVGGSSSQPTIIRSSSPIRNFSLDDMETMYSPQFSKSYYKEESPVEEQEIQIPSLKKTSGRCQPTSMKKTNRKGEEQRCVQWTTEEEVALCKSWVYNSGVNDEVYLQKAQTKYQVEYGIPFTLLYCSEENEVWEVRPSRPMGRDQAKRKGKMVMSSIYLASGVDLEALDRLMVNDPYNVQKGQNLIELLQMKMMELELKAK